MKRTLNSFPAACKQALLAFILFASLLHPCQAQVDLTATSGTASGSYSTLKAAFDAINAGTHKGVITIGISANTSETAAALLNASGSGSASYTAITISPTGGGARTISGSFNGGPLIALNGSDNVTFDGLKTGGNSLTLTNTAAVVTSGTCTIRFANGATSNTVTNCIVLGAFLSSVTSNGGNIYFANDTVTPNGNDNNTISNCDIGPDGSNVPTKGIYGNGSQSTTAIANSGIVIHNNSIYDFFGAAATSAGVYTNGGCKNWTITDNRFYQTQTRTWTAAQYNYPIWIIPSNAIFGAEGFTITGNTIGYASSSQSGTYTLTGSGGRFVGIYLSAITDGTSNDISNNTIAAISMTGVTSSGLAVSSPFAAISIASGVATTSNNAIGSQTETGSLTFSTNSSATDVIGIFNGSNNNWTASGNSIGGITATNTSSSLSVYGMREATLASATATLTSNLVGGTVANSIQNNSTSTASQVVGISLSAATGSVTSNTVRNLSAAGGTGTGGGASLIGILISSGNTNYAISQNTVHTLRNTHASAATILTGIQFNASTGNAISRNFIHSFYAASTAAILNGISVSGGATVFSNNMIRLGIDAGGSSLTNGININGIYDAAGVNDFCFNTIYIGGSGVGTNTGSTYAFRTFLDSGTRSCLNNIFVNARSNTSTGGTHYAIRLNLSTSGLTLNYNDYLASGTGGVFGNFNNANVTSLAAWKSVVGQDANSFNLDPQLIAPDGSSSTLDLHVHPSNATIIEGNGENLPAFSTDFDGQTRSGLTPVDIGADGGDFVQAVLPVELTRFDASTEKKYIALTWETAAELSNEGFGVQRSADGLHLTELAFMPGAGTSNAMHVYFFADEHPLPGLNYYRLRQLDFDERQTYSPIVAAIWRGATEDDFVFFPNPANGMITLRWQAEREDPLKLAIFDLRGKLVKTFELDAAALEKQAVLDLTNLPPGVYFAEWKSNGLRGRQRVILQ